MKHIICIIITIQLTGLLGNHCHSSLLFRGTKSCTTQCVFKCEHYSFKYLHKNPDVVMPSIDALSTYNPIFPTKVLEGYPQKIFRPPPHFIS